MNLLLFNLPVVVLFPFLGAIFVAWSSKIDRYFSAWLSMGITIVTIAIFYPSIELVFQGETLVQSWAWIERVGLHFAFRLDGLSMFFALLILVIGLLITFYARYYLSNKDCMGRFFAYILMFMGSMLGVVLSENILLLVVFWELTSLTSFLLISFWQHKKEARQGARVALGVTAAGGLALLGGVLLLGDIVGSYQLSVVLQSGDIVKEHPLYLLVLILILIGVFAKSAQFPFHFWLPHAMAAPTPVSAYLHSATMVKAGIFLLARFFPVLAGTPEWFWIVSSVGMITLLMGAYIAFFKSDLKGLLAYSTVSHLGLITLLFGFGTKFAVVVALFHIMNHAAFKASLFMIAGAVDHQSGTRDTNKLGGLIKYMPFTAIFAIITSAAMAGVPLFNGFLSKEMFFEEALNISQISTLTSIVPILVTIGGILAVAYSIRFVKDVFLGDISANLPKIPHEAPAMMLLPIGLLALICIAVGIFPLYFAGAMLEITALGSLQDSLPHYKLAIWHGFNIPLLMSAIALCLGVLMYIMRSGLYNFYSRYFESIDAKGYYDSLIDALFKASILITRSFNKGSLQHAAAWIIGSALLFGFYGFYLVDAPLLGSREMLKTDVVTILITLGLISTSLLIMFMHTKRLLTLIIVGLAGLVISLGFVKFSAPDLALTQLSVEIVTIVLLLLALYFLPQSTPVEFNKKRLYRDGALAGLAGIGVVMLTLSVLTRDFAPISDFFLENSVPGGGGTNVVNVILVDFRGFDTLGEIVVLAIAGLGVYAMLKGIKLSSAVKNSDGLAWNSDAHPIIMQTLTRVLFPIMLMFAVFIFIRGHNLPGGGFISGLIASIAIVVQYLANGVVWTQIRLKTDMHKYIGFGLLAGTLTGVVSMLYGYPFLTTSFGYLNWPIVGKFHVASALAFDLGVFLVVVGATIMILVEIGKISTATHKKDFDAQDVSEAK